MIIPPRIPRFMGGIVVVFRKNDPHKTGSWKDGYRGQAGGMPAGIVICPGRGRSTKRMIIGSRWWLRSGGTPYGHVTIPQA